MARFDGMTIIVTGATGGFGHRAAERFYAEGANLVLSDLAADPGAAFAAFDASRHVYVPGDIAKEETSARLVALAKERFGGLDIAFNNAGIAQGFTPLPDIDSTLAQRVVDIDLMGVFYAMKHQIPAMLARARATGRSCAILNTSSLAGVAGAPQLAIYSAAKHGVVGLTRSAAAEFARKGIRVNALCPAFARTEMVLGGLRDTSQTMEEGIAHIVRGVPMRRLGEIDEVMEAVLFACDPANGFMTGQTLTIDGGVSAV
ncbi:oxidoreductase [Zhengella mangrovi]|uniref:Oxidoreductase n=1 Tax=Zhengella mangrovi TaxID=1982044 RepID=A0A2G1QLV3_9HYPH|nr:SDR family oxidoreductase [Zhengella mangrovi]PHP66449.1 oxidoreductase [Zhengella mangrovi]